MIRLPVPPQLQGRVELNLASLTVPETELEHLKAHLTIEELRRGDRLLDKQQREHFFAGRGMLREMLSVRLGKEPAEISLFENAFGKPHLLERGQRGGLRFNVSHAGGYLLVIISERHEVGVDLELIRWDLDYRPMAERYFSAREKESLFRLEPDEQIMAFYRCWTRKEAYMKGAGTGFSQPSTRFDVSLAAAPALVAHRGDPAEPGRWRIFDIQVPEGFCAAMAIENL